MAQRPRPVDFAPLQVDPSTQATLKNRYPRDLADLRNIEKQLSKVLDRVVPATVAVQLGMSAGSGVIVNPEGLVLTAGHVVGDSSRSVVVILPDGRRLKARSLGANHDIDAGMVQIDDPPSDLPYVPLSKKRNLQPGQWVVTTGQPGGLEENRAPPVRLGRVLFRDKEVVCTDCTLVGGDSGGPLVNMQGELVGIHSSIGPRVTHNFHVATSGFVDSWDRLIAGEVWGGDFDQDSEERPIIGVSGKTVNGQCVVSTVTPGLPAAKAGMKAGDIITALDGREIKSFKDLSRSIFFTMPGQQVRLSIKRGDRRTQIVVDVISSAEAEEYLKK